MNEEIMSALGKLGDLTANLVQGHQQLLRRVETSEGELGAVKEPIAQLTELAGHMQRHLVALTETVQSLSGVIQALGNRVDAMDEAVAQLTMRGVDQSGNAQA